MRDDHLFERFVNPAPDFQPATYWFWQRIPTKQEIEAQLNEILESGYSTFFIQPRLAFPIEKYMSKEYLDAYRYAIECASNLGLKAGIYDDYNWNTGHAGGLTVKGHDEYRERQLFWTSSIVNEKSFVLEVTDITTLMGDTLGGPQGQWTYEGGIPVWSDWELVNVIAYSQDHELTPEDKFKDLGKYCSVKSERGDKCTITVDLPNDDYSGYKITAFVVGRCITSRHINYLDKHATGRFIEVGYEPYKEAIGDYFGSTIFCMFMDHPHAGFYSWNQMEGNIKNSLMYDDSLVDSFSKEHNYPIEIAWLSFILPESKFTSKLRGDFINTYGRLAREFFLGQVSVWAHENGLLFAGHELFGFLGIWGFYGGYHVIDQRTDFGGDYFGIGKYKDISTVDAYNSNPQISAKVGDSVARANGDHGCMLEQYYFCTDPNFPGAIGHWNLTFEEMRAQAIRHTIFGTKQFIFHGYYLTDEEGGYELLASSRFDFAPGINYEPWFKHHAKFAQEISRLSAFIYGSEPISEIAVLYPLTSYWVEGSDGILGEQSAVWHQELLEQGLGFDIVDEFNISYDKSTPDRFKIGKNHYKVLVLPGATVLENMDIANELAEFVKAGGILLISGAIPMATIKDGENQELKKMFEELVDQNGNAHFFPNAADSRDHIKELIGSYLFDIPKIEKPKVDSGRIWSWTGKNESAFLVALFNDGKERTRVTISVPIKDVLAEHWDVHTGERKKWLWYEKMDTFTKVFIDIEPQDISCFRIEFPTNQIDNFHLVDSELQVLDASQNGNGPSIKILGDRQGDFDITTATEKGRERKNFSIPAFPKKLVLQNNWKFKIPSSSGFQPISVNTGWEQQGFEDYIGEGIYQTAFDMQSINSDWEGWYWRLEFKSIISSAEIILNDRPLGSLSWSPFKLMIPPNILRPFGNNLTIKVYNTAGNFYYSGSTYNVSKFPSGIIGEPVLNPIKIISIALQA